MPGDDFTEKTAEMNRPVRKFLMKPRTIAYALGFFLLFGLAAGQVGTTSQQLQKYGDAVINYKNPQTKHLIGLLLFSGIASLLVALGSPFLPLFFLAFLVFAMAVIDIVGAGLLNHQSPFSMDSSIYKGLEGISWAKFAVGFLLTVALIADAVIHSKKQQKRHFVYGE